MTRVVETPFQVGEWRVDPELNVLTGPMNDHVLGPQDHHLEPKVMSVLLALAAHPNQVVHKDELMAAVWPDTFVSDDVLTRCISILRRVTEDDAHHPRFIQTVPKVGYRLVAPIAPIAPVKPVAPVVPVSAGVADAIPTHVSAPTAGFEPTTALPPPAAGEVVPGFPWRRTAFAVLVVILATACGILLTAFWGRRSRIADIPVFARTLQFTSGAGEQLQPALAPDGRRMAFVVIPEGGGTRRIYLKEIGSEAMTRLGDTPDTDGEGDQYSPAWSPDGRQIAYLSRWRDHLGLYVADVATHAAHRVYIPQEPSHWEQGALS